MKIKTFLFAIISTYLVIKTGFNIIPSLVTWLSCCVILSIAIKIKGHTQDGLQTYMTPMGKQSQFVKIDCSNEYILDVITKLTATVAFGYLAIALMHKFM